MLCYFGGVISVKEENITRSTVYMPKYLHNKAKQAGLNLSQEVKTYLETILFGDDTQDVSFQLNQLINKKKQLQIELTTVDARIVELETLMKEHDGKKQFEQKLFQKFVNHCKGHIKNSTDNNLPLNTKHLMSYWQKDYFPDNGLKEKNVLVVLDQIKKDCFDFDCFQQLRRGDMIEQ